MPKSEKKYIYIMGDGDNIRNRIEYYLLNSDFDKVTQFSKNLTECIDIIKGLAIRRMNAEIIYAGGDDVLFHIDKNHYQRSYLEEIMDIFLKNTGNTISFGVGENIEVAFLNLRRAKASGKGKIVE